MPIPALTANLTALQQGRDLLAGLSAEAYARRVPEVFDATVGHHLRHVIEHYTSLLDGLPEERIDYEKRARDPALESDINHAAQTLEHLQRRLEQEVDATVPQPLLVRAEHAAATDTWHSSSLHRELEFLVSHTVHHYALIAIVCQRLAVTLPEDFGVAPSTLKYRHAAVTTSA